MVAVIQEESMRRGHGSHRTDGAACPRVDDHDLCRTDRLSQALTPNMSHLRVILGVGVDDGIGACSTSTDRDEVLGLAFGVNENVAARDEVPDVSLGTSYNEDQHDIRIRQYCTLSGRKADLSSAA